MNSGAVQGRQSHRKTAAEDAEARVRIAALKERTEQHHCMIAIFEDKFVQLSAEIGRLTKGCKHS
jgi:hypothetical protein